MNFNKKTFGIITTNKDNALLWGQQMWFILTDVYSKSNINKLQEHKLWLQNITLAIIYHEFLVSGLEDVNPKINLTQFFELPEFKWDKVTLAYLASEEHLGYKYFEDFNKNKQNALLFDLVIKTKSYIFYSLVNHFDSTSNAVFDEMMKTISDDDLKLKFDDLLAWEFVREEFTLLDLH